MAGATLDTHNVSLVDLGRTEHTHADRVIDLRGAAFAGRIFEVGTLRLRARSRLVLDADNAELDELRVRDALDIRKRGTTYLGFTDELLPAGINITLGVDADNTATLALNSELNEPGNHSQLIARSGGTFTAWLSTVNIGTAALDFGGTLDIAAMEVCAIVADTVRIGTVRRGTAKLPPGTFEARDTQVGGGTSGLLELNGTLMTVGETLTIESNGELVIKVGATPAGLSLDPGAALTLAAGARRILVQFNAIPADPHGAHYGVRLAGDRLSELQTMLGDGRIDYEPIEGVIGNRPIEAFVYRGDTYLGIAPLPRGSLLLLK